MESIARRAGVQCLLTLEDYNNCFYYCFGVHGSVVLDTSSRVMYSYGLRKICGMTYPQMADVLNHKGYYHVQDYVTKAVNMLCPISKEWYDIEFADNWKMLKSACKPFGRKKTNAEYCREYQARRRAEKDRGRKISEGKKRAKNNGMSWG